MLLVIGLFIVAAAGSMIYMATASREEPKPQRSFYILEIIKPGAPIAPRMILTYQLNYSADGINQALEFPTRERLEAFLTWLSTRGEITGPADDGGWTELAKATR
jgi:hypothetical protein